MGFLEHIPGKAGETALDTMTEQKKKLLKAKIAAALYHENGNVPTKEEIDKWTKFAKVLYTAILGLHFERQQQKKDKQLAIF
jgi:hypothetical protein